MRDPRVGREVGASAAAIAAICNALTLSESFDLRLLGLVGLVRDAAEHTMRLQQAVAGATDPMRASNSRAREVGAARLILLGRADGLGTARISVGSDAFCATVIEVIEEFVRYTCVKQSFSTLPVEERRVGAGKLAEILFGYTGYIWPQELLVSAMAVADEPWHWGSTDSDSKVQVFMRLLRTHHLAHSANALHQALKRHGVVGARRSKT